MSPERRRYRKNYLLRWLTFLLSIEVAFLSLFLTCYPKLPALLSPPTSVEDKLCFEDTVPPTLELNGPETYSLTVGDSLELPEPTVSDNCQLSPLEISGTFDTTKAGRYEVTYSVTDSAQNQARKTVTISVLPENYGTIYLTFDDGPGPYTATLLDILKRYQAKATFFVTGAGDDELIRREFDEGHAIGLHTLSHNYSLIYSSPDAFFTDLSAVSDRVQCITGETSTLIRFPGGSSNTVSMLYDGGPHIRSYLVSEVEKRGYTYFDWNLSSGDAGGATTSDAVYANIVSRLQPGGTYVVLQHDIKPFSVEAVERVLEYGQANGFIFEKLSATSFSAHHGVNN